jgi:hypothetical protein
MGRRRIENEDSFMDTALFSQKYASERAGSLIDEMAALAKMTIG